MSDIVIAVENLGKKYAIQHQQQIDDSVEEIPIVTARYPCI